MGCCKTLVTGDKEATRTVTRMFLATLFHNKNLAFRKHGRRQGLRNDVRTRKNGRGVGTLQKKHQWRRAPGNMAAGSGLRNEGPLYSIYFMDYATFDKKFSGSTAAAFENSTVNCNLLFPDGPCGQQQMCIGLGTWLCNGRV